MPLATQLINPCGFNQLKMAQISDFVPDISLKEIANCFEKQFINHFEINL